MLVNEYGVDERNLEIVPHGVPNLPLVDPDSVKPRLGLDGRLVILSFGLLGPGKGYESAIAAMPAVIEAIPSAVYVILGATHPDLLQHEGEAYRERLEATVASLGVTDSVRFIDRFVGRLELGTWLEAADLFVTPYPNLDQIVSGTLSYAMSSGKAVVSTPYAYALERLAGGRGTLVAPASSKALADAFIELLGDRRATTGHRRARLCLQPRHDLVHGRAGVRADLRSRGAPGPAGVQAAEEPRGRRWLSSRSTRSIASTWAP